MNTKQTVFVAEYLQCWNASEAARRAGYNGRSNTIGPRLLADVGIAAEIKRRIDEKCMTAGECLMRLGEHARGSMEPFLHINDEGDAVLDLNAAKEAGQLHLIKTFAEAGEKTGARLELYSAQSALELIGKHHKLFTDNINLRMTPEALENWLDGGTSGETESGLD